MTALDDHRTRAGARRREQTRLRLVEAAVTVMARDGADSAFIELVVQQAGVARGSFYNHFSSVQELLTAARRELVTNVLSLILERTAAITDPAERAATGLGLYLRLIADYPVLAHFTCNLGLGDDNMVRVIDTLLIPALTQGMADGRFTKAPPQVLADLLSGCVLAHVLRTASETQPPEHSQKLVAAALRGLGLDTDEATRLSLQDFGVLDLPEDSLLMRTRHLGLTKPRQEQTA